MYVTINYNMHTICIRNMAKSKSIPLMCTHVYSYMFSTVHPPRVILNQTGYMLTSSGFDAFIHLRYLLLQIPLKWWVNFLKPPTSTGRFSNSTGSSATNRQFFPHILGVVLCERRLHYNYLQSSLFWTWSTNFTNGKQSRVMSISLLSASRIACRRSWELWTLNHNIII